MDIVVGTLLLVFGLAIGFAGLRLWFVMLPILGFFAGLSLGVGIMYWIFEEGIFATATGLIIGIFIGLVLAVLSYIFWYVGALAGAGFVGSMVGAGLMRALDVDTNWIIFIVALITALALIILAIILWLPLYIVIVNTSIAGAAWSVAGLMLVFGAIDRAELSYGTVTAAIDESAIWVLVWLIVSTLGILSQISALRSDTLPAERWTRVQLGDRPLA